MQRQRSLVLVPALIVWLSGCSGEYRVAPVPSVPDPVPAAEPTTAPPADPVAAGAAQPPREIPASPAPAPPSPQPAGPAIRLSAGVALPQSLPTGTAMGFSVDYRFVRGEPASASRYVWVIQGNRPEPVRENVELGREGTLQMFALQLRPEDGPFRCHIEDAAGERLSDSIGLR